MNEQQFKATILQRLSNSFQIKEEWSGTCFGKKVRIDALIKPIDNSLWKNKDAIFGIEFKRDIQFSFDPNNKQSTGGQLDAIKQCIDYSYTSFDNIGRIPVFICPGFGFSSNEVSNEMQNLLGRFNIGELKVTDHDGLGLFMHQSIPIWSERRGVYKGKHWSLVTKTGHHQITPLYKTEAEKTTYPSLALKTLESDTFITLKEISPIWLSKKSFINLSNPSSVSLCAV